MVQTSKMYANKLNKGTSLLFDTYSIGLKYILLIQTE